MPRLRLGWTICIACLAGALAFSNSSGRAVEIDGVLAASADIPRVYMVLEDAAGNPLKVNGDIAAIEAFFDTGCSGILLSLETSEQLGMASATYNGSTVTYHDVGVGGEFSVNVSQSEYNYKLGTFSLWSDPNDSSIYFNQTFAPARLQLNQTAAVEPLDIVGTPAMIGRVVVIDPKPPESLETMDVINTYVYGLGDSNIPTTNHHVKLTLSSLDRFTQTQPSGATAPTLAANAFIGANPVSKIDSSVPAGDAPGVTVGFQGKEVTGSFLVDTGAQLSILSTVLASSLHVRYKTGYEPGNKDNYDPVLEIFDPADSANITALGNQFLASVGGLGGSMLVAGFYLDSFLVPTTEGDPLDFRNAPILVADITAADYGGTGDSITLDGIFGMNFLMMSADVDAADIHAGAFNWIVFDANSENPTLGLDVKGVPEPATIALLFVAGTCVLAWRRQRVKSERT
jgi:hypothetical protein